METLKVMLKMRELDDLWRAVLFSSLFYGYMINEAIAKLLLVYQ